MRCAKTTGRQPIPGARKRDVPVRTYLRQDTFEKVKDFAEEVFPFCEDEVNVSATVRVIIERFLKEKNVRRYGDSRARVA